MEDEGAAPLQLSQSAVLIAGGTSGVGLACAREFAKAGSREIAIVGRNPERGEAALRSLKSSYEEVDFRLILADANVVSEARRVVEDTTEAFGRVDVLVNSTAASYVPKLLFRMDLEEIPEILVQQALAPLLLSSAVLGGMREQKRGVIINIASDAAKVPTPGETVLGAAMAAIVTFTRTLAMEGKRDGIRANAVTPSLIGGTNVFDRVMNDPFSAKLFGNAAKLAELGVVQPDDLAGLIVYLASPGAAKLTGQAISMNGGISAA
ncbi:SDR family NAD(P)-dependent oxidoreductase [Sphingomonas sp. ID0503]|uniref:SDR family NAD(P)-dependent oxidoreductase n=1 Tax=Sphingomonas sp. ID0503 TaxID=3399691 RepID=UPI003AFA7472